jgi:hypothetical protein
MVMMITDTIGHFPVSLVVHTRSVDDLRIDRVEIGIITYDRIIHSDAVRSFVGASTEMQRPVRQAVPCCGLRRLVAISVA